MGSGRRGLDSHCEDLAFVQRTLGASNDMIKCAIESITLAAVWAIHCREGRVVADDSREATAIFQAEGSGGLV